MTSAETLKSEIKDLEKQRHELAMQDDFILRYELAFI